MVDVNRLRSDLQLHQTTPLATKSTHVPREQLDAVNKQLDVANERAERLQKRVQELEQQLAERQTA